MIFLPVPNILKRVVYEIIHVFIEGVKIKCFVEIQYNCRPANNYVCFYLIDFYFYGIASGRAKSLTLAIKLNC